MACVCGTIPVCLVHLVDRVYLVGLVYPVSLVQPNRQDKPSKPNKRDRPDRPNRPNEQDRLADFFSILLEQRLLLLEPFDLTHQLLDAILQAGILEPKQVQAIQELLSLDLRPLQRSLQPLQLKLDLLPFVKLR